MGGGRGRGWQRVFVIRGYGAVVPALAAATAPSPVWAAHVASVHRDLSTVAPPVVLVGHSAAGRIIPLVAEGMDGAVGCIYATRSCPSTGSRRPRTTGSSRTCGRSHAATGCRRGPNGGGPRRGRPSSRIRYRAPASRERYPCVPVAAVGETPPPPARPVPSAYLRFSAVYEPEATIASDSGLAGAPRRRRAPAHGRGRGRGRRGTRRPRGSARAPIVARTGPGGRDPPGEDGASGERTHVLADGPSVGQRVAAVRSRSAAECAAQRSACSRNQSRATTAKVRWYSTYAAHAGCHPARARARARRAAGGRRARAGPRRAREEGRRARARRRRRGARSAVSSASTCWSPRRRRRAGANSRAGARRIRVGPGVEPLAVRRLVDVDVVGAQPHSLAPLGEARPPQHGAGLGAQRCRTPVGDDHGDPPRPAPRGRRGVRLDSCSRQRARVRPIST